MQVRDDLLHSRGIGMFEGIDANGAQARSIGNVELVQQFLDQGEGVRTGSHDEGSDVVVGLEGECGACLGLLGGDGFATVTSGLKTTDVVVEPFSSWDRRALGEHRLEHGQQTGRGCVLHPEYFHLGDSSIPLLIQVLDEFSGQFNGILPT